MLFRKEANGLPLIQCDLVLAGNETIAEHARRFCADVRIQATPVDTDLFRPRPRPERERPLVGWVGSPTAAYCLRAIVPALVESKASGIVYVSCDPATLARDLKALCLGGWQLSAVTAVDLFPHTAHVETVCSLRR